jgi:hypothetical protein
MHQLAHDLINKYGQKILKKSALHLKDGAEDIEYFMQKNPIETAIEIGTFRGVTSLLMANYCKKLITFDLYEGQLEYLLNDFEWGQGDRWIDTPYRQQLWFPYGTDNIFFLPVEDNKKKAYYLRELNYDFAFIDGDHSYEGVKADFEMVKDCGRVLFHDYDKAEGKSCPVRDFINSIKEGYIETTTDFAYWEAR